MKILHVTTFFEPELGYEEFHTAKEQAKDGHEVHVICTNLRSDRNLKGQKKYLPAKKETISNINVHRLRCLPELKSEFVIPIGFKNTIRSISPYIIHAHTATQFTSWLAVRFSKKRNFPIMVDIHGLGWQQKENLNLDIQAMKKMIKFCKILGKNIDFVRIDFYYTNKKIYFSEFTFKPYNLKKNNTNWGPIGRYLSSKWNYGLKSYFND